MSQQLANFVWGIADQIRGVYKPAQYGQVILPFTVLRRMECVMNGHRPELIELAAKIPNEAALGAKLRKEHDLHFWNTSSWTLKTLLGDPESLADNLIDYVSAFSANVADIFAEFGFEKTIRKLDENDRLYLVVDAFADDEKVDLHPSALSNAGMGQLFEDLIRRFSDRIERDRRRALHPAGRDPADGRPAAGPGLRRADASRARFGRSTTRPPAPAACCRWPRSAFWR